MEVEWDKEPRAQWEQFHRERAGSLQQSWAYGDAMSALGVRVLRATVRDAGGALARAQFVTRRIAGYISLASCARGPLWREDAPAPLRAQALRALKRSIPVRPLRATVFSLDEPAGPEAEQATAGLWQVMTGQSTVMLDLERPLSALRADLDGKWRNRLARTEASLPFAARVEPSLPECLRLLERESEQRKARRFMGLPTGFVKAYIEASASREQAFAVSFAQVRRETIAGMLFLVHGAGATYHIGWSSDAGRKLNAHNLLLWRGLEHLQRLGVRRLDLGGVNTRALPGISRFKLGTGGQVVTLAGTYH